MKRLLLFVATCIISVNASSQSFHHGLGISIFFDNMVPDKITSIAAITYSPGFNFHETEKMSVSLGIPLSIGFMGDGNNAYDETTEEDEVAAGDINGFTLDVPLMVNLNLGAGSSRMSKGNIGGFIGAGYTYHYSSSRDYTKDSIEKSIGGTSFGLTVNGGIRMGIGDGPIKNIELRLSYYKGRNRTRLGMFGMGAIFNF
ncbi:hypothetical protein SAMN05518672_102337 [Chitinophaga sp. CF118]|uniref:hypothetical protein n=1 Tax=Chitinophaga sp. CF118 TaxID=1884367 RepID=UPI0008F2FE88|nr:hypothetical protein [Chitinophaga sp. CF118]SFD53579.1 hypothetical protein SAMN05518672_102337 [Chitinophaga sp. CF118]